MEAQFTEGNHHTHKRQGGGFNWLAGVALIVLGAVFLIGQLFSVQDAFWSVALIGAGLTFAAVWLTDSRRWWALIPGYILSVTGAFILVEPVMFGDLDAIYWLTAVGLPFLVTYLVNRKNWWALIPAGIMATVATFLLIEPILFGNMDAIYWIAAVGAPFFIVFLTNPRKNWWALIPTYIMATTGAFLFIEPIVRRSDEIIGAYWVFSVALPFFVVYFTNPQQRTWAIIPAGIMGAIGLGLIVAAAEWAIPAALIAGGLFLLARNMRKSGEARPASRPTTGPEADRPLTGPEADRPVEDFEPIGERSAE